MTRNKTLFDYDESERRKLDGMKRARDSKRRAWKLELAREVAAELGRLYRFVTADDVGEELQRRYGIASLGPAAGSLFKTSDWAFDNRYKKSKRITNHSRLLRVWRYEGR